MLRPAKGVLLAGGTGSRLRPLTKTISKHLLPVGREPMIMHPVRKFISAGIRDVLVVTGTEHMGQLVETLGSGRDIGIHFTYRVQDEAGGIAQALGLARDFVGDSPFLVLLGDNIFSGDLRRYVSEFREWSAKLEDWSYAGMVLLSVVSDPERYGVAVITDECLEKIEEKPVKPRSKYAVTGAYLYVGQAIFDLIEGLRPSGRGELEITDLNNALIKAHRIKYAVLEGEWTDAGTFESLARANAIVGVETP